ncbi:MAG: hypothetical protein Q8O40_15945 [Chloroflexota bacterium]|nr:hypothetical protein [Chloroflexota bacterium]
MLPPPGGSTDALLRSLARFGQFGQRVRLMEGRRQGALEAGAVRQLGPDLVFGRLWQSMGVERVLNELLRGRLFEFSVERAVYLAVLHRLFMSGSDRAAERWRRDVVVLGAEGIELHHLYRAMRWLGGQGRSGGGPVGGAARPVHRAVGSLLRHHQPLLRG